MVPVGQSCSITEVSGEPRPRAMTAAITNSKSSRSSGLNGQSGGRPTCSWSMCRWTCLLCTWLTRQSPASWVTPLAKKPESLAYGISRLFQSRVATWAMPFYTWEITPKAWIPKQCILQFSTYSGENNFPYIPWKRLKTAVLQDCSYKYCWPSEGRWNAGLAGSSGSLFHHRNFCCTLSCLSWLCCLSWKLPSSPLGLDLGPSNQALSHHAAPAALAPASAAPATALAFGCPTAPPAFCRFGPLQVEVELLCFSCSTSS